LTRRRRLQQAVPPAASGTPREPGAGKGRWRRRAGWSASVLLLGGVVIGAAHLAEARELLRLLERAEPGWLLLAALFQALTYVAAGGAWGSVVARAGQPLPLRQLVRLAVAKLFTDQAVPSLGVSGILLVVRGLVRRGVRRDVALGALLVDLAGYRLAYGVVLLASLAVLWQRNALHPALVALAAVFALVALLAPLLVLLEPRRLGSLVRPLRRLGAGRRLEQMLAEAPAVVLRDRALLGRVALLELAVFLLDAATLGATLLSVGAVAAPPLLLAGFVMASMASSLGLVPGGLGVFEGAAVGALHLLGVPLAAALAATLLLRGFTFWLPMLPGLWLARREAAR
jgi:uncharacterized protein (TIRG00374 family)